MSRWTREQLDAIQQEGSNILVSAGAGSGKTAVLSERVLRKLKDGVPLSSLLILTFTKAAAEEMKQRIRKKIKQESTLQDQIKQLDLAYITTFDSFALALVRKYHYLLNISSQISIVDSSVMTLQKETILDEIMEHFYEQQNSLFEQFICKYCVKDDQEIRKELFNMHDKLVLKYDLEAYLNTYLKHYMNEENIKEYTASYLQLLKNNIQEIAESVNELSYVVNPEYQNKIIDSLSPLINSQQYEDIKNNCIIRLPNLPKNSEAAKPIKDKIATLLKELGRLTKYESMTQMGTQILDTQDDIECVIMILKELELKLQQWKFQNDLFEFHDIAKMAIHIVKENKWIQEELKTKFNEILLDEYQDTSDLQEMLIQLFANHNVYMVGDMKQSIYRFRNANPTIFKKKYDEYKQKKNGIKIDLQKNFRSRQEPLEDINFIFNRIMQDQIGGASYEEEHQMVFGNQKYTEVKSDQNSHMELYTYQADSNYTKPEIEAFLIAEDIQNKVNSNYQIFDKETEQLRDITYQDFVILMDRTTQFELYHKIFEYCKIPLTVHKDETITAGVDTRLLFHILRLMDCVENKQFKEEFIYSFMSIARSYLFEMNDPDIFHIINTKAFEKTEVYNKIQQLLEECSDYNNEMLIHAIIQKFQFYQHFILLGQIEESMVRLEYLENLATNLSNMGYTRSELLKFLDEIATKNYDVRFSKNETIGNSVHLMTIHKSKGLEFPVCYYALLYAKFNKSDLKERFIYDSKLGFVFPVYNNGIQPTIIKELLKQRYNQEEISEKIRLFYVALTRCCEKLILVMPKVDGNIEPCMKVSPYISLRYQSFQDMLSAIAYDLDPYQIEVFPHSITNKYKIPTQKKVVLSQVDDQLKVNPPHFEQKEVIEQHYSKIPLFITKEDKQKMDYGNQLHQVFERMDWNHPNLESLDLNMKLKVELFLNSELLERPFLNIYPEYEFEYEIEGQKFHGVIDLIIEYEDRIHIIDYKTKNILDLEYRNQLKGYQAYIETITSKKISCYLYSIIEGNYQRID